MRRRSVCRIVPLSALQRPDRTSSCASREKNCCGSQRSRSIRVLFLPYPTCDIHPVPLFPSHWRATVWTHWRRCGLLRFLIFHRARRQRAAKPLIHVQSRILDLRQIRSFGLFLPRQERLDQCFILRQRRSALLFASPFYHRTSIDVPRLAHSPHPQFLHPAASVATTARWSETPSHGPTEASRQTIPFVVKRWSIRTNQGRTGTPPIVRLPMSDHCDVPISPVC